MDMDWALLIARGETMNLDLKGPMAWEDPARACLTEDIVAMANVRDGGLLLIGVGEGGDGAPRIKGLTLEQAGSFDPTKVCEYIAGYFQPPVHVRIERPVVESKQLVAIHVAEFDATPIICIKDGPEKNPGAGKGKRIFYAGNLIVRTPAAKSEAIRTAEDMHALMRLAVTKTSDKLLTDIRRIIEGGTSPIPTSSKPYDSDLAMWSDALAERRDVWDKRYPGYGVFSMVILPDQVIGKRFDHIAMKKLVQQSQVQSQGLTLPNCWEDHTTSIQNRPGAIEGRLDLDQYQELWQLHDTGSFMNASLLHYLEQDNRIVLPFESIIWLVALGVLFAQRLYRELDADQVNYEFKLEGVKDQPLGTFDKFGLRLRGNYRTAENVIIVGGTCTILDLRSGWRAVVQSVIKRMFTLFNWNIEQRAIDQRLNEIEGRP